MKEKRVICPFWTDLSSGDTAGKVYYNAYRRLNIFLLQIETFVMKETKKVSSFSQYI
jgi:hypothetical protein